MYKKTVLQHLLVGEVASQWTLRIYLPRHPFPRAPVLTDTPRPHPTLNGCWASKFRCSACTASNFHTDQFSQPKWHALLSLLFFRDPYRYCQSLNGQVNWVYLQAYFPKLLNVRAPDVFNFSELESSHAHHNSEKQMCVCVCVCTRACLHAHACTCMCACGTHMQVVNICDNLL